MGAITLQFVTCSDPGSWAIRTFQRGWCSHVDSVMDDGRLLGARLGESTTRELGVGSVPDTTEHVTVALVTVAPDAKIKP